MALAKYGLTPNNFVQKIKLMEARDRQKIRLEEILELIIGAPETPAEAEKVAALETSVNTLSRLVDNIRTDATRNSASILNLSNNCNTLDVRTVTLETGFTEFKLKQNENMKLFQDELDVLKFEINEMEQYLRVNNLEIVGLPAPDEGESDTQLILAAINSLQELTTEITVDDVDIAHPIPSKRRDQKRVNIVRFVKRTTKLDILEAKKNERNFQYRNNDIFINEHLSIVNRGLFARASEKKREFGFKYLWTKNGVPCLRKTDNSEIIQITSEKDIQKLNTPERIE